MLHSSYMHIVNYSSQLVLQRIIGIVEHTHILSNSNDPPSIHTYCLLSVVVVVAINLILSDWHSL